MDSVGSLVGIGKTATLEKEYKQLAQEYDRLKKGVQADCHQRGGEADKGTGFGKAESRNGA